MDPYPQHVCSVVLWVHTSKRDFWVISQSSKRWQYCKTCTSLTNKILWGYFPKQWLSHCGVFQWRRQLCLMPIHSSLIPKTRSGKIFHIDKAKVNLRSCIPWLSKVELDNLGSPQRYWPCKYIIMWYRAGIGHILVAILLGSCQYWSGSGTL